MADALTRWRFAAGSALLGACALIVMAVSWATSGVSGRHGSRATTELSSPPASIGPPAQLAQIDHAAFDRVLVREAPPPPPLPSVPARSETPFSIPDLELVAILHEDGAPSVAAIYDPRSDRLWVLRVGDDLAPDGRVTDLSADSVELAFGEHRAALSLERGRAGR
ncbi:MAG: hypothetical protein H6811_01535 [Phycisphaeraceae bacterium]|nr:hypothetical protein [Phycisphaeraceae bacterium]